MDPAPREDRSPYLRIEHLSKQFGQFTALHDVSLSIDEGEFVCFLGPSGCGKTTLLRAIAGLDVQSSGRVFQNGRDISALPPAERDFGIVFQSYALFPNMTVAKNVAYGLESGKRSRAEIRARVSELLELVGLSDQGDKYPAQLSGGQQQRVALARAIATSPGLLLLDEPLSALDAKVRVYLRREVRDLQRRLGITTIMVTHDQEEGLTMADRIVVMNQGVVEQVGTPVEIYRHPATSFVADFIGSMNFLPGKMVAHDRVQVGGLELGCAPTELASGEEITVAVRPEDIVLERSGTVADNGFRGRIGTVEFLGSFVRVELRGQAIGEAVLSADVAINIVRQLGLAEGDEVSVSIPAECIRVYRGRVGHG